MTEEKHLNYGRAVRSLREDHKMTLETLAEAAGVSPSYLSEIERGLKRPSTDVVAKIAGAFEMSPSGFLEYVEAISGAEAEAFSRVVAYSQRLMAAEPLPPPARAAPALKRESPQLSLLMSHARKLDEGDLKTLVELARRLLRRERK